GEREKRRRIVHQRRQLVQIAAARGGEQAFAGARDRRGQAGEIGDDFGNGGRRGEVALDLVGARLGWLARRRRVRRLCRLAAKVARRNHAAARDERQQQEAQANAQQHGSAADRGSPPVYQKDGIGGEWPQREPRGELRRNGIRFAGARSAPRRNQRGAWRLLLGHGEGKFAVADAPGKALGETRRCLLAVGRDEFGKGGKQARL